MIVNKILNITKGLESTKHPLLGPNLRGLYLFGLWQKGNKIRNFFFNIFHAMSFIFVLTQFYALYQMKDDIMQVILNFSLTAVSLVSISKNFRTIFYQTKWNQLFDNIANEERKEIAKGDKTVLKYMRDYTVYSRIVTYLYWSTAIVTYFVLLVSPFFKYAAEPVYRELVSNGTEPYPQILCSWFPFDNTVMPGYIYGIICHVIVTTQGAGVIAVFDMNAVTIMTFLKGQVQILGYKCENIFDTRKALDKKEVFGNIKECYRLHSFISEQYSLLNSLLSPVMFLYVLICSIMICCSIVQLSLNELAITQKLLILEYTVALVVQLFIYCWHSNELAVLSGSVDRGVYNSNWWTSDVTSRKLLLILAGKMSTPFIFDAGPFTTLSVPTFIEIMKGSYSFYTLFARLEETTSD
ncbi:unnamed protein product [Colias eurytheme]|nr:unnamed protein product [Colias eurytheme]